MRKNIEKGLTCGAKGRGLKEGIDGMVGPFGMSNVRPESGLFLGSEFFAHPSPEKGLYQVFVIYYGAGSSVSELTVAQIAIIANENTPHEKRQVFYAPLRRAGDLILVSSFVYP